VLISPYALASVSQKERNISIHLTKKQIEDSPSLDSEKPVSRQFETDYYGYYGWPMYWGGPYMWGGYPYMYPGVGMYAGVGIYPGVGQERQHSDQEATWDAHLRSTNAVDGYHIQASDGEIGHVSDFVFDDST
jgi:hypothetical protein